MDRNTAEHITGSIIKLSQALNETAASIEHIQDEDERKQFRRAIAELMIGVDDKLMRPVFKQYRDLDPHLES